MAIPNYVKFQRGSLAAYNRLSIKDENTLYFIYDANDNEKGTLYLGSRLIGSIGGSSGVSNLSELSDVITTEAHTGDFLVLNSEGKWIATSASDVAQAILDTGGNFVHIDENEFQFNTVNGKLELKGYSSAATNMVPVKTSNGLSWATLPSTVELSTRVGNLETELNNTQSNVTILQNQFQTIDGKISTAISQANHLRYQTISSFSEATETNVIYLYQDQNSTDPNNQYKEYMLVGNQLECIGSITDIDLSDYITTTVFETRVGNLETQISNLSSLSPVVSNLQTNVNILSTTVGNLQTTVGTLSDKISALESNTNNYVLKTTFNKVVGNLELINGVYNNLNTDASVSDNLEDIYERLTWQEIV